MAEKHEKSVEAVERILDIGGYIDLYKDPIFRNTEEHYRRVMGKPDTPLIFIFETVPLVSSVIQVGCVRENFRKAVCWAKTLLPEPDADANSFLNNLTLIYILEKGRDEFAVSEDEEKKALWSQMAEAVLTQLQCV